LEDMTLGVLMPGMILTPATGDVHNSG